MSNATTAEKPNNATTAALCFVLIIIALIISVVNFVQSEGHSAPSEEHGNSVPAAAHHAEPAGENNSQH